MIVDDTMLMEYVDGTAGPQLRAQVEAAVAASQEVAERLVAMRASVLPYGAAFAQQVLPAVPESLVEHVNRLAVRRERRRAPLQWLAVAFFAGVFGSSIAFKALSWASDDSLVVTRLVSLVSPVPRVTRWVQAVVDYQDLYSRETLANITEDDNLASQVVSEIQRVDGMPVRVPDLSAAGLKFKRVQRLNYKGRPLAQIVYLGGRGAPVALCAITDAGLDTPPRTQQVGDMKVVTWRKGNVGYVLVAKDAPVNVTQIGASIVKGETPVLYGSVAEYGSVLSWFTLA